MKKIIAIVALAFLAINTQAQKNAKKAVEETINTINEMDQMLGKEFSQITTALDVVNGNQFLMGDCMVLGAFADESFKKNCKALEDEFGKMFNSSTWSFEKYNPNGQSLVKVKTKSGQTESSPYSGFQGDATVRIGTLIQGLTIQAYFYQNKEDKNKYMMAFPVQQMMLFVEVTKKEGGAAAADVPAKNNATDVAAKTTETITSSPKAEDIKSKAKNRLLNKVKL
jgi:hypothetical protein